MFNNIVIIVASITMSSTAHVLLKRGMMANVEQSLAQNGMVESVWIAATNPWVLGGMFLHVSALVVWLWALSRVDITFAYPFLALGYVLVSLIAWWWLGEQLTQGKILGMSIIILGIFVLSISGQTQS